MDKSGTGQKKDQFSYHMEISTQENQRVKNKLPLGLKGGRVQQAGQSTRHHIENRATVSGGKVWGEPKEGIIQGQYSQVPVGFIIMKDKNKTNKANETNSEIAGITQCGEVYRDVL